MSLLNNLFGSGAQNSILGTSEDEMYRNHMDHLRAHEAEMVRQKYADAAQNQYSQQLAMSMAQTKQAVTQSIYNSMAAGQAIKPFNPNEQEAYKIPLSNLVTLWQAKYGDEWVETSQEEFWHDASKRLSHAGKTEQVSGWYRIKEDV
jgi:hypothetical protein